MTLSASEHIIDQPMKDIFGHEGALARFMPEFEPRQGQLQMAEAVFQALIDGSRLAVEAGTGIGKTLAYLAPAIQSGQKVVISTGTLNLQDQILHKEIPFIQRYIAPRLVALCVKGRQNYLCLYRWNQLMTAPQLPIFGDSDEINRISAWLDTTDTGDRAELTWLPDNSPLWREISSSTTQCLGMHCPQNHSCFITRLRKKAARAQLLIVNHHLFFSDLAIRRHGHAEVLPRYESVIFDEAHHIENIATRYFGISFSHYQVLDLIKDIEKTAAADLSQKDRNKVVQPARAVAKEIELFAQLFPKERGRYQLSEVIKEISPWETELDRLLGALQGLSTELELISKTREAWGPLLRRSTDLEDSLLLTTREQNSSFVYWVERREKTISLTASPIEVAGELQHFYQDVHSAIFASATLTTGSDFRYFLDRLGLGAETATLPIQAPFDYAGRTLLYVPDNRFPLPNHPDYPRESHQQIFDIIGASNGRALLLFTSLNAMRNCHAALKDKLDYPLLMQGDAPKSVLLERFQKDTHSVLLAVASFWEGVDVPGESLSAVIIDKLPFEVPTDPVIMARVNRIREEGGNPFFDFQVPRAILTLRQGIGRLIRTASDQGLLAIMDVRLFTKSYGRLFMKSLPPSPVVRSMQDVRSFLDNLKDDTQTTFNKD